MSKKMVEVELKCRRCGTFNIIDIAPDEGYSYLNARELIFQVFGNDDALVIAPKQVGCVKCKKDTIQDVVSYIDNL